VEVRNRKNDVVPMKVHPVPQPSPDLCARNLNPASLFGIGVDEEGMKLIHFGTSAAFPLNCDGELFGGGKLCRQPV
jgi:hypothetical protein